MNLLTETSVYGSSKSDPKHPSAESAKKFARVTRPFWSLSQTNTQARDCSRKTRTALNQRTHSLPNSSGSQARCSPLGGDSEAPHTFVAVLAAFQEPLPPPDVSQFAVGDHFTIANTALAPFLSC